MLVLAKHYINEKMIIERTTQVVILSGPLKLLLNLYVSLIYARLFLIN